MSASGNAKIATAAFSNAINAHDEVLYNPETGIIKLVKLIKIQFNRKLGTGSETHGQIPRLSLGNIDKRIEKLGMNQKV